MVMGHDSTTRIGDPDNKKKRSLERLRLGETTGPDWRNEITGSSA
jgi:hypothetical protein